MNYWLDLFTGTTWREFRDAGANVSGFRAKQVKSAKQTKRGDIFLCYLTGVMRWVGAPEILGTSTDTRKIWQEQDFSVRFEVKPVIPLEPEHGILMQQLRSFDDAFLHGKKLTANQVEFVNLIVDHLTQLGWMEPSLLYESPFTDFSPRGVEGVFRSEDVNRLVSILTSIREHAAVQPKKETLPVCRLT